MSVPLHVLILEDRPADAELTLHELRRAGFAPVWRRVETEADYLAALDPSLDLILADYAMPQFDGLRALELLRARGLAIPFIIVSGTIGEESAVAAMRQGATDYLLKDRLARLGAAVKQALEQRRLQAAKLRADQMLDASEQRFRALIEHSSDGIALVGADGIILYASPSTTRILGYAPEALVGQVGFTLIHPDDQEGARAGLAALLEQPGKSATAQSRVRHGDGGWRWIELAANNLLAEPNVGTVVLNYRDITARIQAEDQIRRLNADLEQRVADRTADLARTNTELQAEIVERIQLEQQIQANADRATALATLSQALAEASLNMQPLFETIVQHIAPLVGDACILTILSDDRQTMQVMAIGHTNPAGIAFMRTLFPAPYPAREGMAGRVVRTGQPMLVPIIPPDQIRAQLKPEYLPYLDRFGISSLLIVPLRARGRILGTLGVSRDRPGRPYTNVDQTFLQDLADRAGLAIENAGLFAAAEHARAEAERANRAKSVFLAGMSHELRTPLNAILGFTGTLLMQLPGPLNADQAKQLTTVQRSGKHLLSLINDLLDLARIESGNVELSLVPVVFQDVLAVAAASLRPLAEEKQLQFLVETPAEPIVVSSDARALSQILINLISNAIKFTDTGMVCVALAREPVTADYRRPTIDHREPDSVVGGQSSVVFHVRDTGIGIRAEDQARLFQEFGRVDSAAVRAREGSGLGLQLSRKLAELLGGRIELTSAIGIGSTFTLILPEA
jgi:PAS domain S-box-containing protein